MYIILGKKWFYPNGDDLCEFKIISGDFMILLEISEKRWQEMKREAEGEYRWRSPSGLTPPGTR